MSLTKEQDGIEVATPELDKLMALDGENELIGSFLEWLLLERGWDICEQNDFGDYYPIHLGIEAILSRYFDIDLKKIDVEKRAILDALREQRGEES